MTLLVPMRIIHMQCGICSSSCSISVGVYNNLNFRTKPNLSWSSAFHKSLFWSFPKQFQGPLCQSNYFTFTFFSILIIRLDMFLGNLLDHLNDVLSFGNQTNQLLVVGLQ